MASSNHHRAMIIVPTRVGSGTGNKQCTMHSIIIYTICAFVCMAAVSGGGAQAHGDKTHVQTGVHLAPTTDIEGLDGHVQRHSQSSLVGMNITLLVGDGAELVVDTTTGSYQLLLDGVVSTLHWPIFCNVASASIYSLARMLHGAITHYHSFVHSSTESISRLFHQTRLHVKLRNHVFFLSAVHSLTCSCIRRFTQTLTHPLFLTSITFTLDDSLTSCSYSCSHPHDHSGMAARDSTVHRYS